MRERRHDLRDVLLAKHRAKQKHYPHLIHDSDCEGRILESSEKAVKKTWLRGLEEVVRDASHIVEPWSTEARAEFLAEVQATTGQSVFAIAEAIEKPVETLIRRRRARCSEFDLRLLRDYGPDGPEGRFWSEAAAIVDRFGA